ncbi:ras-related protein Rab-43 isoform X2 [Chiloscyllium plagiosum]|uniref:ras-related protein Rab-43 isoform X2 n=1 Tax=Chiloscyllium plagiosum TaxID=36176 RepID=UPI001CB8389C|nr:ras-related protein Rab-43 isoform X2 [Chiloscyllium plagiosum]
MSWSGIVAPGSRYGSVEGIGSMGSCFTGVGRLAFIAFSQFHKKLQIWDTAGQERFRTITQSYYRSANGAIVAYDISKRGSFESVPRWIEDVKKYAGSNIVQLLIGNKSDKNHVREVQYEEAKTLAVHYDMASVLETSAKDSSNVEEAFIKMATELMLRHAGPMFTEKASESIKLNSKDVGEGWGCSC